VLCAAEQIQSLKPNAITRKRDARNAVALDAENNNIQVKDVVKVTDGPHSVRTAVFIPL
jgi:transcription elongation factor SPT5